MVALADIALQPSEGLVVLADISKRQDISLPYLEQLFVKLRRGGLVRQVTGAFSPAASRLFWALRASGLGPLPNPLPPVVNLPCVLKQ